MKIFEFNPGIGALSVGFEYFGTNIVTQVQKINKNELFSYNSCHKQQFSVSKDEFIEISKLKDHDLGLLRPDFGISMTQKRFKEVKYYDLWSCLAYIEQFKPKIAIIITPVSVIPYLNTSFNYVEDGFHMVSKDMVVESMQKSGYMAWQLAIDQVQYGVPMYYPVNFYVAVRNDLGKPEDACQPTILHGTSSGKRPYFSVADAIADLSACRYEDACTYSTPSLNTYQAWCRKSAEDTVMNNVSSPVKPEHIELIRNMPEGVMSKVWTEGKIAKGSRSRADRPGDLGPDYHKLTGKGASIHPICPRPFTIREGMRIHGLPDHIILKDDISLNKQAAMVHEQISPLIAGPLHQMIDPYITPQNGF